MPRRIKSNRKWKILVTPKEACDKMGDLQHKWSNYLDITQTHGRVENVEKLVKLLHEKDGVVLDLEPITADVLRRCPSLKVISRFGEGCDNIDLKCAKRHAVRVTRTAGVSSLAVARHAMALILAITHRIVENDGNLKRGIWLRQNNIAEPQVTLGIAGLGKIGKLVARLGEAFGFRIVVYSRSKAPTRYRTVNRLSELAESCDILSLHLSLTTCTRRIISKAIIHRLKGKYLVNTARGGLVDEEELLGSLENEGIAGYATDVFLNEPLSGVSKKLAMHSKVIASPHIAAFDQDTSIRVTERALSNALHCLNEDQGKVISYVV